MCGTPIRAALERPEAEGPVAVSRRQGIAACEPFLDEIAEHLEIRLPLPRHVLESLAPRLAK
jgi:DNA-binding GntR family transcriptional regulator